MKTIFMAFYLVFMLIIIAAVAIIIVVSFLSFTINREVCSLYFLWGINVFYFTTNYII